MTRAVRLCYACTGRICVRSGIGMAEHVCSPAPLCLRLLANPWQPTALQCVRQRPCWHQGSRFMGSQTPLSILTPTLLVAIFAVRASMLMSAPEQPSAVAPDARDQQEGIRNKPRK